MSRQEMIDAMEWTAPDSGLGYGVCAVGNMLMWAMDAPGPGHPDLKSIVAVLGPPGQYTNAEIRRLWAFSQRRTRDYDRMFRYRRGCNLIIIGKHTWSCGAWIRKRQSWDRGPITSPTLGEAMAIFDDQYAKTRSAP